MDVLKEEVGKSNIHQVDQFDREGFTFSVCETINYRDKRSMKTFKAWWCDCGEFQVLHMPCSHVIATYSTFHHDYRVLIP